MKVSFDFDSTLEHDEMQDLARKLIEAGHEVWITSSRSMLGSNVRVVNEDLFAIAKSLGIEKQVQLTSGDYKFRFLHEFDMHFDDNQMEVDLINSANNSCIGVIYNNKQIKKRLI